MITQNFNFVTRKNNRHSYLSCRFYDLFFAGVGIVLFTPIFFLLGICIFLEDRGSIFFIQKRIGQNRVPFYVIKFRTMRDGKITRVGQLIRKTGLDEITQFFNVIKGEMNMVGPRPLTMEDIHRLQWSHESYSWRWTVKPGITGFAQIFGGYSARHSLRLDRIYLKRTCVTIDNKLIFISFMMNIFGKRRIRALLRRFRSLSRMRLRNL